MARNLKTFKSSSNVASNFIDSEQKADSRYPSAFKNVPKKILIEIFEFLDGESLKASRLVTKKWNEIISKSPELMKKLMLVIDDYRGFELDTFSNFSRCYQTIELQNFRHVNKVHFILNYISGKRTNLKLSHCIIDRNYYSFIKSFDSVDFLDCISNPMNFKLDPKAFAACKALEVTNSDFDTCGCFENLQLTQLVYYRMRTIDWPRLIQFLAKQTRLSFLIIQTTEEIPDGLEVKATVVKSVEKLVFSYSENEFLVKFLGLNLFSNSVKSLAFRRFKHEDDEESWPEDGEEESDEEREEYEPDEADNDEQYDEDPEEESVENEDEESSEGDEEESDEEAEDLVQDRDNGFVALNSVVSRFNSLVDLKLESFEFNAEDNLEELQPLESVKNLSLSFSRFESYDEFTKFFKLFPHLSEFEIYFSTNEAQTEKKFWRWFLNRDNLKNFFGELKSLKVYLDEWLNDWMNFNPTCREVAILRNNLLNVEIYLMRGFSFESLSEYLPNLALKIFKLFDLPKEGLKMSQHKAQEMPKWKPVTEEDF